MIRNIIRQSEPYEWLLEYEIEEMKNEGYEDWVIVDSIDELIRDLETMRDKFF